MATIALKDKPASSVASPSQTKPAFQQSKDGIKKHRGGKREQQRKRDMKKDGKNPKIQTEANGIGKIQEGITFYSSLFKKAEKLMQLKEQEFFTKLQREKDGEWLLTLLKKGTASDKISALSMIVQKDPVRSLSYLTSLLNLARKKNKKQAEYSIGALRDLFCQHLLPGDSKLHPFSKNPLLVRAGRNEEIKEKDLLQAYFENQLRDFYREFVTKVLADLTHDDLEFYKKFSLNILEQLLESKPELESEILSLIVNKLGDLNRKIQCHTIFVLIKLTQAHIQMAEVIVREVHLFIERPGTKKGHIYYAIAFLNRVAAMVAPKDERVRIALLKIYFALFKKMVKSDKDGEASQAAIVKPKKDRTKSKEQRLKEEKLAKKQLKQSKTNELGQEDNKVAELVLKGVNTLMVRCQALDLSTTTGNDLRKLIEDETNVLFQLSHHEVFRIQIQTLKLLFQFCKATSKKNSAEIQVEKTEQDGEGSFADRYYRTLYELLLRLHLNKSSKLDEFFSLLFKSMKADTNMVRVLSFMRRIIQMCFANETSFTAASLLIISEVIKARDDIRFHLYSFDKLVNINNTSSNRNQDDSDEEERFIDVDRLEELKEKATAIQPQVKASGEKQWSQNYDCLKREPKFSNADKNPLWELIPLSAHCHPTISLWANSLIQGDRISYGGDPLLDFGIANFLDRIAYKNPKSLEKASKFAKRMSAVEKPINQYDFKSDELPQNREEEEYLYKYFKLKPESKKFKLKEGEDDGEDTDPELEAFAEQVIEKEMKKIAGQGAEESDAEDDSVLEQLQNGEDEDEEDLDGEENEEGEDFFEGEDLSDVDVGNADEEDDEAQMNQSYQGEDEELQDEDDQESVQDDNDDQDDDGYGMEDGDDGEDIEEEEELKPKSSKKGGKKKASIFAEYDEFAEMLEEDLNQDKKNFKKKSETTLGNKRSYQQRGNSHRKGGKKGGNFGVNKRQKHK